MSRQGVIKFAQAIRVEHQMFLQFLSHRCPQTSELNRHKCPSFFRGATRSIPLARYQRSMLRFLRPVVGSSDQFFSELATMSLATMHLLQHKLQVWHTSLDLRRCWRELQLDMLHRDFLRHNLGTPAKNASVFFDHCRKSASFGLPRPSTSVSLGVSFSSSKLCDSVLNCHRHTSRIDPGSNSKRGTNNRKLLTRRETSGAPPKTKALWQLWWSRPPLPAPFPEAQVYSRSF